MHLIFSGIYCVTTSFFVLLSRMEDIKVILSLMTVWHCFLNSIRWFLNFHIFVLPLTPRAQSHSLIGTVSILVDSRCSRMRSHVSKSTWHRKRPPLDTRYCSSNISNLASLFKCKKKRTFSISLMTPGPELLTCLLLVALITILHWCWRLFAGSVAQFIEITSNPHGSGLDEIRYLFNNKSASDHEIFKKTFSRLVG